MSNPRNELIQSAKSKFYWTARFSQTKQKDATKPRDESDQAASTFIVSPTVSLALAEMEPDSAQKITGEAGTPPWPTVKDYYTIIDTIGVGTFAFVYSAFCKPRREKCAVKCVDLKKWSSSLENLLKDVQSMTLFNHDNVVTYYTAFVDSEELWLVLRCMENGSLRDIIRRRMRSINCKHGVFDEPIIATILAGVASGLEYLHRNGYIHRDIKADNILLGGDGSVVIADFAITNCIAKMRTFVGSPYWLAPEIIEDSKHVYSDKADIWSFGITAIEIATGAPPYHKHPTMKVLMMTLLNEIPSLETEAELRGQYKKYGKTFRSLISSCVQKEPSKRPTAEGLLFHPFFKKREDQSFLQQVLAGIPSDVESRWRKQTKKPAELFKKVQRREWVLEIEPEEDLAEERPRLYPNDIDVRKTVPCKRTSSPSEEPCSPLSVKSSTCRFKATVVLHIILRIRGLHLDTSMILKTAIWWFERETDCILAVTELWVSTYKMDAEPSDLKGSSSRKTRHEKSTDMQEEEDDYDKEEEEMEDDDEYETDDFISKPQFSPTATYERDPLELEYSYGYDCQNPNLCVVDSETLLWHTGNIIHIFNSKQRRLTFRRSALGQDLSYIAKSKSTDEFAVAENGGDIGSVSPMIIVYKWPDFKVVSVLRGGASRCYKCIDFSMDGSKLISQGGHPDRTLTLWDLSTSTAITSFQNPDESVSKATFSSYDPDAFITCGPGHIKFWRLVDTFTGLKIESAPGRFGEVENNDVSALCFLPEGRVVSNFCGGNLAIWTENANLEISMSMKNCEPCHSDLVTFIQIYLKDNHVYSAGLDGKVRVWNYLYITGFYNDEQQDSVHIDIEPSYERTIKDNKGHTGKPVLILPKDEIEYPYHFYVQDIKGGIWILDLELKKNPDPWVRLFSCHSGPVNDMSPSPGDYYLATVGEGGTMNVYSHAEKALVISKLFNEDGTAILWLPLEADSKGCSIVIGFRSGVLRVVVVMLKFLQKSVVPEEQVSVVQSIRPHSSSITAMSINHSGKVLVSGSADGSIFLHSFANRRGVTVLRPLAMIIVPGPVCDITWNPYRPKRRILSVTCDNGQVAEIRISQQDWDVIKLSSQKGRDERETYVVNIPLIITNAKIRSKKATPKLYFSRYVDDNLIWIEEKSSEHSYHNYLYEVGGEPAAKLNISEGHAVQSCAEVHGGRYIILGLNNGRIKIIKKSSEPGDFSDSWEIVMHKTRNCTIKKVCASYDHKIVYSCGTDSGIFAYRLNLESDFTVPVRTLPPVTELPQAIDEDGIPELSLEDEKIKMKTDKERMEHGRQVDKFKRKLNVFLNSYYRLIEINKSLPKCLRIPKSYFRLETKEERLKEKQKLMEHEDAMFAPLKARQEKLFERVHAIKKHFIDPIKTPKFYLFAVRAPHYLKSFPERRLFTKDPLGDAGDSPDQGERMDKWENLLTGSSGKKEDSTEFERMSRKITAKLEKDREMDTYYDSRKGDASKAKDLQGHEEIGLGEEVPDLITAAGEFLCEYDKFTPAEKTAFKRINRNRLRRQKCVKDMEQVDKLRVGFQGYYDKIEGYFNNLIKAEIKDKERVTPVTEKLHHLLNIRQLIYLHKEKFNKSLKELRNEKSQIINYFYWAQEEYKYMVKDLKRWTLDLEGIELPPPLEVVWDLEYPDSLTFTPRAMPNDIADRMEFYKKELDKIEGLVPVNELKLEGSDVHKHRLFPLLKYRQERFKNSVILIRETLDSMINEFDDKFLPLLLKRSKTSLEVNDLKAEYSSVLQEVDVLYRFEILQTSASSYKYETLKIKHVQILRENVRKKKINAFNEQVKECHRTIDDLNAKFMEMVKDDKWAKHLARTYKRKFKPPKGSDTEGSLQSSESSSDGDDDDYDDDLSGDDDDESTGVGVAYLYDENIVPPGCDEDKFKQMFKFRAQRHAEENKINEIRKEKEDIVEEVKEIRKTIKITDVLLALFFSGTYRFHKMMREEMDDIEFLVNLSPKQIQIFDKDDPLNNVPPIEECKLIEQDDYLARVKILKQMKAAIDEVGELVEKTRMASKSQVKELEKLAEQNAQRQQDIDKLLRVKFGERMDVDAGQTFVLTGMIKKAISRCAQDIKEAERQGRKEMDEMDRLKQKEELIKMKKERMKTLHTLYTIEAENNRIMAEKMSHRQKVRTSTMNLAEEKEALALKLGEVENEEKNLMAALKDV